MRRLKRPSPIGLTNASPYGKASCLCGSIPRAAELPEGRSRENANRRWTARFWGGPAIALVYIRVIIVGNGVGSIDYGRSNPGRDEARQKEKTDRSNEENALDLSEEYFGSRNKRRESYRGEERRKSDAGLRPS